PEFHRSGAEFRIELSVELLWRNSARGVQVGGARRLEERHHVAQAVFDRAEARTVAPALTDVERRLTIIALRPIDRTQGRDVIKPALLTARPAIQSHPPAHFHRPS